MAPPAVIHNADIAAVLREIADLLEIKGGNPFRIRAYRNLARTLEALGPSVQTMLAEQRDLDELPGVGPDLAGKLAEIVHTGSCALREQLLGELPAGLHTLLSVPGIGPRKVMALYRELGIHNLDQLAAAARDGSLCAVRGFGERAAQRILDNLHSRQSKTTRFPLAYAAVVLGPLLAWLKDGVPGAVAEAAGSYRRRQETVGDLDIVAHARHPGALIERFVQYPDVQEVRAHGGTRASVLLRQGIQVDLRVVPAASYGAAMHYFTGSKSHNIVLRRLAQERGWKLNEYGLYQGDERIAGATEHSIFAALGMDDIPPELRENRGEVGAAQEHRLPHLVGRRDLRGDLHVHTKAGAGHDSLRAMALAARAQDLHYIAVTDRGLDPEALWRQREEIAQLNAELEDITILHGVEVDILPDGRLDLPDGVLAQLDLVIGAVQTDFSLPRAEQTRRGPSQLRVAGPPDRPPAVGARCL